MDGLFGCCEDSNTDDETRSDDISEVATMKKVDIFLCLMTDQVSCFVPSHTYTTASEVTATSATEESKPPSLRRRASRHRYGGEQAAIATEESKPSSAPAESSSAAAEPVAKLTTAV
ncbi:hypothetical protein E4T56_gene15599 [Termitomyces sp. T112]|nr:hypothetical protein E4T56_gene15599 [Termitomyces sp. T112]KAH0587305.1 hypothetical protein H2248_006107 [Termitomyces sp. 'cryptogamus']